MARFLAMLNTRVRDYALETGLTFPFDSLALVMRRAVDQDTADRMDEAGVDLANFRKVVEWILKREARLRARGGGAGACKRPDAMVYGVSAAEAAGAAPPGNAATVQSVLHRTLGPALQQIPGQEQHSSTAATDAGSSAATAARA